MSLHRTFLATALGLLALPAAFAQAAEAPAAPPVSAFTALHVFNGKPEGDQPWGPVVVASDGNFYGVTRAGGTFGLGSVYKTAANGTTGTLYSFDGAAHGSTPTSLIEASNGDLVGTTSDGGPANAGTVFKLTKAGQYTLLHAFHGTPDGEGFALGGLVQGLTGVFYGVTDNGGAGAGLAGCGTVFSITKSGGFKVIHTFPADGTSGCGLKTALVQGLDGVLYGGAEGGKNANGVLYRIKTSGQSFSVLHQFDDSHLGDGSAPRGALTQGVDGRFYGVAEFGGDPACQCGTVFRMSTTGHFKVIHRFTEQSAVDGGYPFGPLVYDGSDGYLHGVTMSDGQAGLGVLYKMTPSGSTYSVSHRFAGPDGKYPWAGLTLHAADGILYGATSAGGNADGQGKGVIFAIPQGE
jgi:uncharacterized repeat protein (TIGR03803 family)